jgi:hypothetical protein
MKPDLLMQEQVDVSRSAPRCRVSVGFTSDSRGIPSPLIYAWLGWQLWHRRQRPQ